MSDVQGRKKDKNQHIQVFARVRPANQAEIHGKSSTVVEVPSPRECVVRERPQDKLTKKFTFDRVFGPLSKQLDVYNAVVSPLLEEVLAGYNCTVFAYGQTGTGKTFTMEGHSNDPAIHWQSDTSAGIIPRALSHLFDELRLMESQEYTVRVSFLELYNEELFDLLSPNDDASKIRLFEDAAKKGAVIIHGLEEVTVHNKNEVYKILEKGSEKRQTAATLMNAHSSRSHTVFSITVHIKENTVDGEELLKTGKLNLVDLAGSENVGRSGAVDRRAREAGSINQSLLTLGRVITALVERAPHIPYRESKLTRLLQESLGGRTKTSIIATVSPASVNLEETLSTLDYAHRAKNITNRPEINQKLSKKALLKEYTEEIERLRRDLTATRERNGVYLAADNYNNMQSTIEFQEKEIEEKINHIKALEETMVAKEQLLMELKIDLDKTKYEVVLTQQERDEQKYLVERHVNTEKKLLKQAKTLLEVADTASVDTLRLHDKIERKNNIEKENETIGEEFKINIMEQFDHIQNDLANFIETSMNFYSTSREKIVDQRNISSKFSAETIQRLSCDLIKEQKSAADDMTKSIKLSYRNYGEWFMDEFNNTTALTDFEREGLRKIVEIFVPKISNLVRNDIDENLRNINEETSKQLIYIHDCTKNTIQSMMDQYINENNSLKKKIESLTDYLRNSEKLIDKLVINENKFMQLIQENSIKLHEERSKLKAEFDTSYKFGLETCQNADLQVKDMSKFKNQIDQFIDNDFSNNVTSVREKLCEQLENNCKLSRAAVEQSETINSELTTELENASERLAEYKNKFGERTNKYKNCMNSDLQRTLTSIENESKLINNAAKYHEKQTDAYCKIFENNITEMNNKFDQQNSTTIDWNDKFKQNLERTQLKVEQFLDVDLKHDIPTGTTPAKKDFSYPRQLVMTSPHGRLIQRYRQINSIPLTNGNPLESPMIDCLSSSTPISSNEIKSEIISNRSSLTKSASVSDIHANVINSDPNDSIAKSESDIFNKENNGDSGIVNINDSGFAKPSSRLPKFGLKTRSVNGKRILSPRND